MANEAKERLFRYNKPNQYDHLPRGTEIYVLTTKELYQQVSRDSEDPQWMIIDSPLVKKHCFLGTFE